MRFYGLTLAAASLVLGACGGGDNNKVADTTAAMTPAPAATSTEMAPAAGAPAAGGMAAMPATGKTVDVKMIGDDKGYRFEPANITIKAGDAIKFTNVSGGPHNAAFDPATIPADVKGQLSANMPEQMAELNGKLLVNPNDTYTISFAGIKPGKYDYHCTPHLAMNMKGTITVQ